MPLRRGSSRTAISSNIRTLKREHPDWSQKRVVAAALNNARRTSRGPLPKYLRKGSARRNPADDNTMTVIYVVGGLLALVGIGTAIYFAMKKNAPAQMSSSSPSATPPPASTNTNANTPPETSAQVAQQQQQQQVQQQPPQQQPLPKLAPILQQLAQYV